MKTFKEFINESRLKRMLVVKKVPTTNEYTLNWEKRAYFIKKQMSNILQKVKEIFESNDDKNLDYDKWTDTLIGKLYDEYQNKLHDGYQNQDYPPRLFREDIKYIRKLLDEMNARLWK